MLCISTLRFARNLGSIPPARSGSTCGLAVAVMSHDSCGSADPLVGTSARSQRPKADSPMTHSSSAQRHTLDWLAYLGWSRAEGTTLIRSLGARFDSQP